MSNQHIQQATGAYFHIMLNIADDDLSVYEYRLLGHYIRVGNCWESTPETAKRTKMSSGMVSKTRARLAAKGWISVEYRDNNQTCIVTVLDRMEENVSRYKGVHVVNTSEGKGVHVVNAGVHVVKQRITNEEERTPPNPQTRVGQQMHLSILRNATGMGTERAERVSALIVESFPAICPEQLARFYSEWECDHPRAKKPMNWNILKDHLTTWLASKVPVQGQRRLSDDGRWQEWNGESWQ